MQSLWSALQDNKNFLKNNALNYQIMNQIISQILHSIILCSSYWLVSNLTISPSSGVYFWWYCIFWKACEVLYKILQKYCTRSVENHNRRSGEYQQATHFVDGSIFYCIFLLRTPILMILDLLENLQKSLHLEPDIIPIWHTIKLWNKSNSFLSLCPSRILGTCEHILTHIFVVAIVLSSNSSKP